MLSFHLNNKLFMISLSVPDTGIQDAFQTYLGLTKLTISWGRLQWG